MIVKMLWNNVDRQLSPPAEMGEPRADQLQGTAWDNLVELAGRVCYDSLGTGRNSRDYHAHIHESGHLSVLEHATFTVSLPAWVSAETFLNRPCLWVRRDDAGDWRVTMNLRHVIEWDQWGDDGLLSAPLLAVAQDLAPLAGGGLPQVPHASRVTYAFPEAPEEIWITFFISSVSRGLTHELVRHGDYTAISQRSTRYCDESDGEWAWHPELLQRWDDPVYTAREDSRIGDVCESIRQHASWSYHMLVTTLVADGVPRKAARGAARGVLGNALSTELLFSASLAQWSRILRQRNNPAADGELRLMAEQVQEVLTRGGFLASM